MRDTTSRRKLIAGLSGAALTLVAGCSGGGGEGTEAGADDAAGEAATEVGEEAGEVGTEVGEEAGEVATEVDEESALGSEENETTINETTINETTTTEEGA